MSRPYSLFVFALVLCALAAGIVIGTLLDGDVRAVPRVAAPDAASLSIPDPVQLSNAFSILARRVEPAVVNITTSKGSGSRSAARQEEGDDQNPFRRFFEPPYGDDGAFRGSSIGSGVVVDRNGYIITNWHVVEEASKILVKVHGDRKEYEAKLIGGDFETDIAVIKIDAGRPLEAAPVGNSDAVQVGDWVVAIGSPFGLDATVTAGIISAKQRELADAQAFQRFLQTDAAINPGNSGGPLLNIRGEVIGINTAIASNSGRYQGVGFAMPMNTAVGVYNQIVKGGRVTRGSIGISLNRSDDPEVLRAYGVDEGVIVAGVHASGPAERAGIQVDDVILEIAGRKIASGSALIDQVSSLPVGDEVPIVIQRDGKRLNKRVLIGDRAQLFGDRARNGLPPPQDSPQTPTAPASVNLGISIQNVPQDRLREWSFPEDHGVLISRVESGSLGEAVGLRADDVIVSAGGQPIRAVEDIRTYRERLRPGDAIAFRVYRKLGSPRPDTTTWTRFFAAGTVPGVATPGATGPAPGPGGALPAAPAPGRQP
ncbi:MAG: trypsin-like peptidase domain-containing protein [Bryobacterales bacterium]|nr:trypsin-like peptidase domain-containing protein [Bryobacterales bacterium]